MTAHLRCQLAALSFLTFAAAASATNLDYYYGYSSPTFTSNGLASDPLQNQNVSFMPQVETITVAPASAGYSSYGQPAGAYSAPAATTSSFMSYSAMGSGMSGLGGGSSWQNWGVSDPIISQPQPTSSFDSVLTAATFSSGMNFGAQYVAPPPVVVIPSNSTPSPSSQVSVVTDQANIFANPEPSSWVLFITGAAGLVYLHRRRTSSAH